METYTIEKIFANRLFRIPDYQRGYAWEKQQCQDFVEDLELLGPGKQHFFGTLILHALSDGSTKVMDESGSFYKVHGIVDGQQRLTSVVLFLNAIRKEMQRCNYRLRWASGLKEKYVVVYDENGKPMPKLTLNRDTHGYFFNSILEQGQDIDGARIRSHRLLDSAKGYFVEYLAQKQAELRDGYPDWLRRQSEKVTQQLTLMVYTVRSEADAGVIFETMNNRGKPITELEKVKNYLLYLVGKLELRRDHGLANEINDTWTHIFERLMAADLSSVSNEDQMLRAHWLMAYDFRPANWRGSRSVKERFNLHRYRDRHKDLSKDLRAYLSSLRNATVAYCEIFRPTHSNAFGVFKTEKTLRYEIVSAAEKLARMGSLATFQPLLMAVRIKLPTDGQAYLEAVRLCEKFSFRVYRWLRYRANAGQSRIFRLGYDFYQSQTPDTQNVLDRLRQAILDYCSDVQFQDRFRREEENWYNWSGLKYFLYEYEHHLAEKAGLAVLMPWEILTKKQDTIEHILPQTMEEGGYWAERFTPEKHRKYVHDIGNLTLTYDNSVLSNKPFPQKKGDPDKKECYASSKIFVEHQMASYESWTVAEILARRRELETWAMGRWHVESPSSVRVTDDVDGGDKPTFQDYHRLLTRIPVPRGQQRLYKILYDAGEGGLTYDELIEAMKPWGRKSLAGVLGALGKRINGTPGYGRTKKPGVYMVFFYEQIGQDQWLIRLLPEARLALESLNSTWLREVVQ